MGAWATARPPVGGISAVAGTGTQRMCHKSHHVYGAVCLLFRPYGMAPVPVLKFSRAFFFLPARRLFDRLRGGDACVGPWYSTLHRIYY